MKAMESRKLKKIVLLAKALICSIFIYAQPGVLPCEKLPQNKQLKARLLEKPVKPGDVYEYRLGCNVDDSLKNRIVDLLNWKWTEEELQKCVDRSLITAKDFYKIEDKAKKISKGNDSLFRHAKDSIEREIRYENYQNLIHSGNMYVSDNLILISAKLKIKEAVPILNEARTDSNHYNISCVELALARLGDKNLQRKIIQSCTYNPLSADSFIMIYQREIAPKLIFVNTQESIFKLQEWLDTTLLVSLTSGTKPDTKCAYRVISDLRMLIANTDFQEKLKDIPRYWYSLNGYKNNDLIIFCRKWLQKNKGHYLISNEYYPY